MNTTSIQRRPVSRTSAGIAALLALAVGLLLSGCQSSAPDQHSAGSFSRYGVYLRGEVPERYQDLSNPLPESAENLAAGGRLYQDHCAACHGASGNGDGPAAAGLEPAPANLGFTRMTPMGSDRFFFWTISEGGASLGTAMPVFAEQLEDEQIWQIVGYVQQGL